MTSDPTTQADERETLTSADLVSYLAGRDAERARRAHGIYQSLNTHDQRLVREAAVMGYVLGSMGNPSVTNDTFPNDDQIVASVLLRIDREEPPHFPALRRACNRAHRLGLTK